MLDLSFDSKTSEVWMLKDLLVEALYIANGGFNHCATSKLIQIVKKNCSFFIYILTANPLLALRILTPNHFLFYEPALSRCQINGTEMLRVNLSACFELKTRTASTTAIKRSTSWDGLFRFRAISQDQRVAKTNSFNRKWCCLLSKFGKWLSKFVDLSWKQEKTISEKKHEPSPVFVHCSIFVIARWIILSIYLSTQYGRGVTACQKDAQNLLNMFAWCWCSPPSCRDHTDVTDSTFFNFNTRPPPLSS